MLKKTHGSLPVTILRPSIIVACFDDPFMGWIDSPAASGGITMGVEMGVMRMVYSHPDAIMDLIPCDFVSNSVLVQTAITAMEPKPKLNVVHSATTTKNAISVWRIRNLFLEYAQYNPWYAQVSKPWAYPVYSLNLFKFGITVTETIPLVLTEAYAGAIGDHKLKK